MKRSRSLVIALCFIMMIAVLAGCGKGTEQKPDTTPKNTTEATDGTGSGKLFDETLAFTIITTDHVHYTPAMFEEGGLFYELNEKLNVDIDWVMEPETGFAEKLSTILASANLPEVIKMDSDASLASWREEGALIPLDDLLQEYGQNILNTYTDEDLVFLRDIEDGKIYNIRAKMMVKGAYSTAIRSDWLNDLDMATPTTLDELEACLVAFKENDMYGGGATVPWGGPLNAFYWAYGISRIDSPAQDINTGILYIMYDGKYIPYTDHPHYRDFLTKVASLYEQGLLNKEYLIRNKDSAKMQEIWNTGQAGAGNWWAAVFQNASNTARENDPDALYQTIKSVKGPYGDQMIAGRKTLDTINVFTVEAEKSGKAEDIMKFYNWVFGEEGQTYFGFGIEGEHYNLVDGQPKFTDFYSDGWVNKRAVGIDPVASLACVQSLEGYNQSMLKGKSPDELDEIGSLVYNGFTINDPYIFAAPRTIDTESSIKLGPVIYPSLQTIETQAIAGEITVDEFYEKYNELKADGLDQITAEINEAYDRIK